MIGPCARFHDMGVSNSEQDSMSLPPENANQLLGHIAR